MSSIRILLADDQTLIRRLLARRLAQETDLQIVGEAEDGRQAVEMALRLMPDVILMDLQMPHLNGIQATERILAQRSHIRIIMVTALDDLAELGKSAGAYACLDKSCTPEELVAIIRQAFRSTPAKTTEAAGDYSAAIERLSSRANLTDREKVVVTKAVTTELTIQQMATSLSSDLEEKVTQSAVKHALERAMTKLRIEPRTRAALVKRVLEFDQSTRSSEGVGR